MFYSVNLDNDLNQVFDSVHKRLENERRIQLQTVTEFVKTDDGYELVYVIPGVKREEVSLAAHNNVLRLNIEAKGNAGQAKHYRKYFKDFTLPADADLDSIKALHEDGVLAITFKKLIPKIKVRNIQIA
jgi:HSP20 family molecular chaperone IbpA